MPTKTNRPSRLRPFLVLTVLGVVGMCAVEAGYIAWAVCGADPCCDWGIAGGRAEPNAQGLTWVFLGDRKGARFDTRAAWVQPVGVSLRSPEVRRDDVGFTSLVVVRTPQVEMPSWSVLSEPPAAGLALDTLVVESASGWPVRLYLWRRFLGPSGWDIEAPIPTSPLAWKNAAVFLAASTVLSAASSFGLLRLGGWLRRRRARLRNVCEHCGYSLAGLDRASSTATCPECGEPSASGTVPGR